MSESLTDADERRSKSGRVTRTKPVWELCEKAALER